VINNGKKVKRKITALDRAVDRDNALKGTSKWSATSHPARVRRIRKRPKTWGFDGKSPKTRKRKYK